METETQAGITLADSMTITDGVILGRPDLRGKVHASEVLTRAELQAVVQQAYDVYGIAADPFASPGSADTPVPDAWAAAFRNGPVGAL